ncbi:MAG TPA: hypothetical protein VMT72_16845, partial [Pseudolabrys sp.]|nr:hypothetical protein [Pseudolabrys sp.]
VAERQQFHAWLSNASVAAGSPSRGLNFFHSDSPCNRRLSLLSVRLGEAAFPIIPATRTYSIAEIPDDENPSTLGKPLTWLPSKLERLANDRLSA